MVIENKPAATIPQHVYRLAIYGRPNSGKTCILAALGVTRDPHPEGLSCIWICDETTVACPQGSREHWDPYDPNVAAYLGKEWLRKAVARLEAGDVPPATPPDAAPFRLFFDFTSTDGRIFRVEMIDYSGELVNPDLSEEQLTKKLLQHMEEADGVLILAEAPRPGDEHAPLFRELQRLQQAFMAIAERRRGKQTERFPIALVLNKWDRVSRMEYFTPGQAELEARMFLEKQPPVPQKTLSNVLTAVAGKEGDEPLSKPFGLSAFGKSKTIKRQTEKGEVLVDVPSRVDPLPAFGLEDPFVWLCQKADMLAENDLKSSYASLGPWKIWQLFTGKARRVVAEAKAYGKRFPRSFKQATFAKELATKCRFALFQQCVVACSFMFVVILAGIEGMFAVYDNTRFVALSPAIKKDDPPDPLEILPQWTEAEDFLAAYQRPSWYRFGSHWVNLSPTKAKEDLENLRPRINSAHALVASRDQLRGSLKIIDTRISSSVNISDVETIIGELRRLSIPSKLPQEEGEKKRLLQLAEVQKTKINDSTDKGKLRKAYAGYFERNNIAEAADFIVRDCEKYPDLKQELEAQFRENGPRALTAFVNRECQQSRWPDALKRVQDFRNSQAVLGIIGAVKRDRAGILEKHIKDHRKETNYSRWHYDPDNSSYQTEVLSGPDSEYRSAVQEYLNYKSYLKTKYDWQVTVESVYIKKNMTVFNAGMVVQIDRQFNRICTSNTVTHTKANESLNVNSSFTVKDLTVDERFSISLNLMETTATFRDNVSFGSYANYSVSIRQLANGASIALSSNEQAYEGNVVYLRLGTSLRTLPSRPTPNTPTAVQYS